MANVRNFYLSSNNIIDIFYNAHFPYELGVLCCNFLLFKIMLSNSGIIVFEMDNTIQALTLSSYFNLTYLILTTSGHVNLFQEQNDITRNTLLNLGI